MLARRLFMSQDSEDPMVTGDYFYIEALTDGVTISLDATDIEYNLNDGAGWIGLTAGSTSRSVSSGEKIYIRANGVPTSSGIGTFTISDACSIGGNIMSLLLHDDFEGQTDLTGYNYAFYKLFYRAPIIYASDLLLPATRLAPSCYSYMFYNCSSLRDTPELPATRLADSCYSAMFCGCKQLKVAPALPATELRSYCYELMFLNCGYLISAPPLPATTLADFCYWRMFQGCTALNKVPSLPATTLAPSCYRMMFSNCTFLTTVPPLLATTLDESCYSYMFSGCTNLKYIMMLATDISAPACLERWVSGVASSGTFVKNSAMTSLPTGISGIPEGWTVIDA